MFSCEFYEIFKKTFFAEHVLYYFWEQWLIIT